MLPTAASHRGLTVLSWILQVALGGLFLVAGFSKLGGEPSMVGFFAEIGWGQWFRYFIGALEVVSAVLLVISRAAFAGAVLLSLSLALHIVTHAFVLHQPAAFLVLLLAASLLVAFLRRPTHASA